MKTTFDMNMDNNKLWHGTLEVRGTRARLEFDQSFGTFTDFHDIEDLANYLLSAVEVMRHNGSCSDCGGKGYTFLGIERINCRKCLAQGVSISVN